MIYQAEELGPQVPATELSKDEAMPTSLDVHEGSINSQRVVTLVIAGTAFIGRRACDNGCGITLQWRILKSGKLFW